MLIKNKSQSGFTLLELMVALAVIAVLAAVAMPLIKDYKWRAHRIEARNALQALSQRLNTAYQVNKAFVDKNGKKLEFGDDDIKTVIGDGKNPLVPRNCAGANCYYKFTKLEVSDTKTSYTIEVEAYGAQERKDKKCKKFFLTNTGLKGATDANDKDNVKECWSR